MKKITGIYKFLNTVNGKVYIGQASDIHRRKYNHYYRLNSGTHSNEHFQAAYNKYHRNAFHFSIVEECLSEDLDEKEIYWILKYNAIDEKCGYNKTLPGEQIYAENPNAFKREVITVNIITREVKEYVSVIELREFLNTKSNKVADVIQYWTGTRTKQIRKTYRGCAIMDKSIFEDMGIEEVIKKATTKKEFNRSAATIKGHINRGHNIGKKAIIPYEERNLLRRAVLVVNIGDGKEYEFRSIKEAVNELKLNPGKVMKLLKNEYKKYKHRGYWMKYL